MGKLNSLGYNWNEAERVEAIYSHHYGLFVIGDQKLRLELFAPGCKMLVEFSTLPGFRKGSRQQIPTQEHRLAARDMHIATRLDNLVIAGFHTADCFIENDVRSLFPRWHALRLATEDKRERRTL